MGGAPYERYASFYDDGIWYADIPRYGYAGFRRDEARNDAGTGSYWGTWKLTGSEGELTRPSVTRKMPLKILKDDEIELDHTHYYRCASVDGMKLDGAWTSYANPADPDLKKPGGTKAILHFSPDGHFRDDGLFALFLGSMDGPVKSAPGSGTYEIKDWTLILRYDDGHVRTAAFSMFVRGKADPKASSIYVQRTRLNRVP